MVKRLKGFSSNLSGEAQQEFEDLIHFFFNLLSEDSLSLGTFISPSFFLFSILGPNTCVRGQQARFLFKPVLDLPG